MTLSTISPPPSIEFSRQRVAQAEAIKDAWRMGEIPDAAVALDTHPELASDHAIALDLAYEEYCVREEKGEAIGPSDFCARFPFANSLRRLLTVHRFLDDHPDALGGVPARWPTSGEIVDDFIIVRELGRGGFSRVYLGIETTAGDRPVAVKVSAAGSREAATLGPLSHPHLIPVLSSRSIGTWTVVAMPFVGTATLEDVITTAWGTGRDPSGSHRSAALILTAVSRGSHPEDPPFPARPAFPIVPARPYEDGIRAIAARLFAALSYLHEKGIAHRDLKPSNVLLGPTGHPYLLDFNLATTLAEPLRLVGTLPYVAPEQLLLLNNPSAPPPIDWRAADVFASGVVLFELLTGRHPFGAFGNQGDVQNPDKLATALFHAQRGGHPAISTLNPRVDRVIGKAIERCLAIEPSDRPTAAQLAELFSHCDRVPSHWRRFASGLVGIGCLLLPVGYSLTEKTTQPVTVAHADVDPLARGLLLYRKGEYSLAAGEFRDVGFARQDGRAYAYASYCLSLRKEYVAATTAANEAIRLGYKLAPVYANRAYSHLHARHLETAKEDCDQALSLDPGLHAVRFTRMMVWLQLHLQHGITIDSEAITDANLATASPLIGPDKWIVAAQLYVLAPGTNAAMHDQAARAVREGILGGKDPQVIARNPQLQRHLKGHPIYDEALQLPSTKAPPAQNVHLVSPIDY